MQQEKKYESDARETPPSFDELVDMIKKLFVDYLEDVLKSPPSETEKSWERYKTLNHLYKPAQHPGSIGWVKASEFKIVYGTNYYAKWLDGNIKATGRFQEADGTFFWNVPGYVPIGKHEYEHLQILDESNEQPVGSQWINCENKMPVIVTPAKLIIVKRYEGLPDVFSVRAMTPAQLADIVKWDLANFEWLNEQPEQKENDALCLLKWLSEHEWGCVGNGEYICHKNGRIIKEATLYNEYKKQNK